MAKGTIIGSTSNENITCRIDWSSTPYSGENKSFLQVALQYKRLNSGFTTYGHGNFGIYIDGDGVIENNYANIGESWSTVYTFSRDIDHEPDGTKIVYLQAVGSISGTTLTGTDCEGTITLDTIPRASTLDALSCNTAYFTGNMTFKYTPKSASFYNRCNIALNINGTYTAVKTINIGQKAASQQTTTVGLSTSELSTIYNNLPSTTKGTLRFTFRTYSDLGYSSQIGDPVYKEISLSIPNTSDTKPTVTMTLSPVSDFTSTSAIYVKGRSKVRAAFTSGAGKYGATITSYTLTVEGKDYGSSASYTSGFLTTSGDITVKGKVTDSRGFTNTYSQTISVLDYTKPTLDLLSADTRYFTGTLTYKYTPPNSSFYSQCVVTLGTTTIKTISLGQKSAGQQTATLSLSDSELSTIYNKLPSTDNGILKFTFRSYINSGYTEQIGDDSYKEITLYVPDIDATKPTATISITPVTSLSSSFDSLYVKGKTQVKVELKEGVGKYGASIKSYTVAVDGKSATPPYTSEHLIKTGNITITGTVTDSRGYSRTYTEEITVIDYSPPQILPASDESEVIVARCNSSGTLSDNGEYLKIKAKRNFSKVISANVQKNFCALQYRYKASGGSYSDWEPILDKSSASDEVVTGALLDGTLATTTSYFVQVRAIDDVGESVIWATTISTEKVYMHRAGSRNSLALGKLAEEDNTFDVAEDITAVFRGEVRFSGEAWTARALGTNVAASSTTSGRWGGSGVYYRVCAGGKHIYVAFNVSFTTSSSTVRAESQTIPSAYRPNYDVYALCPVGFSDNSRGIATVSVSPSGRVNIYAVHKLPGATLSTGETVAWIDGYIDYWT